MNFEYIHVFLKMKEGNQHFLEAKNYFLIAIMSIEETRWHLGREIKSD